jgi:hypothetical protein
MGPHSTPTDRYFTRKEAAALCGTSADTIKRAQGRGLFPGARPRPGCPSRTTEIPYVDLVNAGLYSPPAAGGEPDEELRRIQDGDRLSELTVKVAELQAVADERLARMKESDSLVRRLTTAIEHLSAAAAGGGR